MGGALEGQTGLVGGGAWDAVLYDSKHSWVWKAGQEVIEHLSPQPGERILDLGCGTGHMAHQVALAGARVVGLDCSLPMIRRARCLYPNIPFVLGDASRFAFSRPFDAIFSNAAIHWVQDRNGLASSIADALRSGGRFVADFGGKGNSQAIFEALDVVWKEMGTASRLHRRVWYLPGIGEFSSLLERHGLAVRYARLFDRPTPLEDGEQGLANWLRMFAGDFLGGLSQQMQRELITRIENRLRPTLYRGGIWYADRRGIFVVAVRE